MEVCYFFKQIENSEVKFGSEKLYQYSLSFYVLVLKDFGKREYVNFFIEFYYSREVKDSKG